MVIGDNICDFLSNSFDEKGMLILHGILCENEVLSESDCEMLNNCRDVLLSRYGGITRDMIRFLEGVMNSM